MSYETISVRMNRSDPSIAWGFTLKQQADAIVIASTVPDSLSEKAGLRCGDRVETICGSRGSSLNQANSLVQNARNEINFTLQRYVTSHTCLPWTLTEKDNKLIVDEMKPGFGSGFNNQNSSSSFSQSMRSPGARSLPITQTNAASQNYTSNYNSSQQQQHHSSSSTGARPGGPLSPLSGPISAPSGQAAPARVFHSPSSYTSSQKNQGYMMNHPIKTTGNGSAPTGGHSYSTHQTTNYSSTNGAPNYNAQGANYNANINSSAAPATNYNNSAAGFTSSYGQQNGNQAPVAQNYSFNNGRSTNTYQGSGSGGVPLNQTAFIQTQMSPPGAGAHASSLSPGGTRIRYHSPSSRTRRDLSHNCSIQHLQYNSPMNLYSGDAAAEQYQQQTGRNVDARVTNQSPAYLTSETKRLIEESEGRVPRGISPSSTQSSSFKRISQAVGAPLQ